MDQLRRVAVFADLQDEDKVCLEGAEESGLPRARIWSRKEPAHNFSCC
jgi:hypothetical protein